MSDIDELVKRLTDNDHCPAGTVDCYSRCRGLMQQAADALTAQQQEIERLREALHEIKLLPHHNDVNGNELICRAADIADAALTGKEI